MYQTRDELLCIGAVEDRLMTGDGGAGTRTASGSTRGPVGVVCGRGVAAEVGVANIEGVVYRVWPENVPALCRGKILRVGISVAEVLYL